MFYRLRTYDLSRRMDYIMDYTQREITGRHIMIILMLCYCTVLCCIVVFI